MWALTAYIAHNGLYTIGAGCCTTISRRADFNKIKKSLSASFSLGVILTWSKIRFMSLLKTQKNLLKKRVLKKLCLGHFTKILTENCDPPFPVDKNR